MDGRNEDDDWRGMDRRGPPDEPNISARGGARDEEPLLHQLPPPAPCIAPSAPLPLPGDRDTSPPSDSAPGGPAPLPVLLPAIEGPEGDKVKLARQLVERELDELEKWALGNLADSRRDRVRFWIFKGPAMISAAASSVLEAVHLGWVVIVLGLITAVFVVIDGAYPGGLLHNVHLAAAHELRALQHKARTMFNTAELRNDVVNAAPGILEMIQKERANIGKEITAVEASLGKARRA